jgi:hypothetical protein
VNQTNRRAPVAAPPPNPSAVSADVLTTAPEVTHVAQRGDVVRVETTITLPPSFQYVIPGRKKVDGQWVDDNKVGITSDGYDFLNRVLGVSFYLPDWVPDESGELCRNPIHRPDYIYIRMGAVWYNESGQLVTTTEDLEVDFRHVYANARLESYESVPVLENGYPVFDDYGNPVVKVKDADAERKALKALMQLRTMGMRYAQTVLRTRLVKIACGIKSLPGNEARARNLRITGFRDAMDPVTRIAKAEASVRAMYGAIPPARPEAPALKADEMADIEPPDADDEAMATLIEATMPEQAPDDGGGEFHV